MIPIEKTVLKIKPQILSTAECAPTLAPWRPQIDATTSEATQHSNDVETHAVYDINDIVHFEDNDLVMRDAKRVKTHDNNKMDNSVDPYNSFTYNDVKKRLLIDKSRDLIDVGNDLKDDGNKEESCECQHGGGCVANVCLCPLGYAGVKCEITLDLKVRTDVKNIVDVVFEKMFEFTKITFSFDLSLTQRVLSNYF